MQKSIYLDTNVLLDSIMIRSGADAAKQILEFGVKKSVRICLSSLSVANISYVARKNVTKEKLLEVFELYLKHFVILPDNDMGVLHAVRSGHPDFEDAMQIACAEYELCDAIITRNKKHFEPYTDIPVYTPEELIAKISS